MSETIQQALWRLSNCESEKLILERRNAELEQENAELKRINERFVEEVEQLASAQPLIPRPLSPKGE